jgi:uncharacterized protein YqhQ
MSLTRAGQLLLSEISAEDPVADLRFDDLKAFFGSKSDETSISKKEPTEERKEGSKKSKATPLFLAIALTIIFIILCLPITDYILANNFRLCGTKIIQFVFKAFIFFLLALAFCYWFSSALKKKKDVSENLERHPIKE